MATNERSPGKKWGRHDTAALASRNSKRRIVGVCIFLSAELNAALSFRRIRDRLRVAINREASFSDVQRAFVKPVADPNQRTSFASKRCNFGVCDNASRISVR